MSQEASNDGKKNGTDPSIYENRGPKKIIRLITVMAYICSVSFVGVALSAYYLFLWEPPNPRLLHTSRYRGEPDVQYLQAHPSFEPSRSHGHDYTGHFVLETNDNLIKSQVPLARAPVNPHYSRDTDAFKKPLNVLKSSIADTLRKRGNSSLSPANVPANNVFGFNNAINISVNNETTRVKTIVFSTNFENATVSNLKVPSVVKSAIISGTEKTVDRTMNRPSLAAYSRYNKTIIPRPQNQTKQLQKGTVLIKIYDKPYEHFLSDTSIKENHLTIPTEDNLQTIKSLLAFGKKEVQQFSAESIAQISPEHSVSSNKQLLRSNLSEAEDGFSKRSIVSIHDSRSNLGVKYLKETELQSTWQSQETTTFGETQLENVATRSAARDNDEELSNIITPQQKGLLTLSLESTDMQKNASSATTEITHSTLSAESNASPEITQENIS